jgi:hypothetical protein
VHTKLFPPFLNGKLEEVSIALSHSIMFILAKKYCYFYKSEWPQAQCKIKLIAQPFAQKAEEKDNKL